MSTATLPMKPLVDALGATSVAKLARLVEENVATVRAAWEAGSAGQELVEGWARNAGLDPARVWSSDPVSVVQRLIAERQAEPIDVPVVERATGRELPMPTFTPTEEDLVLPEDHAVPTLSLPRGEIVRLEFVDELPPPRPNQRGRHFSWLEAVGPSLVANPGRWLKLRECPTYNLAGSRRKHLQRAMGVGYEVEIRPATPASGPHDTHYLWVRWVGIEQEGRVEA